MQQNIEFKNYQEQLKKIIDIFPNKASKIQNQYEKYINTCMDDFVNIDLKENEKLNEYLNENILVPILNYNIEQIEIKIQKDIKQFLEGINLKKEYENFMLYFLQNCDDEVLNTLIQLQKYYIVENDKEENQIINENIHELELISIKYNINLYKFYEINFKEDCFLYHQSYVNMILIQTIQNKYSNFQKKTQSILKDALKTSQNQIKNELSHNLENLTFKSLISLKQEYFQLRIKIFQQELIQDLNFLPHKLISQPFDDELQIFIQDLLEDQFQQKQSIQNNLFQSPLSQNFEYFLYKKLNNKENDNFSFLNIDQKNNLTKILCLSYLQNNKKDRTLYLEYIQEINDKYFPEIQIQKQYNHEQKNQYTLQQDEDLKELKQIWQNSINQQQYFQIFFQLFWEISGQTLDFENNIIKSHKIDLKKRQFLLIALKNLQTNDQNDFFYYDILIFLENFLEKKLSIQKFKFDKVNMNDQDLIKNQIDKVIDQYEEQKSQIFQFKKLDEQQLKTISIIIPGYTSENKDPKNSWKNVINYAHNSSVFFLNWKSSNFQDIFTEDVLGNAQYLINFNLQQPIIQLGKAVYQLYKIYDDNSFNRAYDEAIVTGKQLAFLLSHNDSPFKNYIINIISFSLGTLIAQTLLETLEKNNINNIIQEVVFMGGVVNLQQIENISYNSALYIKNCYSQHDKILQFYKFTKYGKNPAGLQPIKTKNHKVENYDFQNIIKTHQGYKQILPQILRKINYNSDYQ